MDFVTVSTGLILPYWMGLPIRYIQNAVLYYTIEGELLDEAPIYCGTYIAWTSDEKAILFEINPKKVPVKVTYNKDWRE